MITVISIAGWQNFVAGVNSRNKFNEGGLNLDNGLSNLTTTNPILGVDMTVTSFDPSKSDTLAFTIDFYPSNELIGDNVDQFSPNVTVQVVLMTTTTNFPANKLIQSQSINQVLDGDVNGYPFDVYTVDYYIGAYTSPSTTGYGTPLPMIILTQGAIQGFIVDTDLQPALPNGSDGSQVLVTFTVRRSTTTKTFAIIIFMVMWGLSLSIFTAAMSVWFREKKVELPLIAISTALLFALPNIRNSQPGVPPIAGVTSDMVGFFWNLLLVAISAVSLLINWIIKNARERPAAKSSSADVEVALLNGHK